jgi:ABC-type multidrug transport system fused ATPase/permease subunit
LNYVPSEIVQLLQAKVSLDRIEAFLNEPEVDDQISSLKKETADNNRDDSVAPLGFKNASFRWNSTELVNSLEERADRKKSASSVIITAEDSASVNSDQLEAVRFELRDINIMFPQGKLTVVTGPTASGKTALMVSQLQS